MQWMEKQRTGDWRAKAVLFWFSWRHNAETGLCCPSIPMLMADMEVDSKNTVKAGIRKLVQLGLVSFKDVIDKKGKHREYRLHFEVIVGGNVSTSTKGHIVTPGQIATLGQDVTPGQDMTGDGSCGDPREGHVVTPNRELKGNKPDLLLVATPAQKLGNSEKAGYGNAPTQTPVQICTGTPLNGGTPGNMGTPGYMGTGTHENAGMGTTENRGTGTPVFRGHSEIQRNRDTEVLPVGTSPQISPTDVSAADSLFPPAENPQPKTAKPKRKPPVLVTFPETLPEEWRQAALKLRPDIDPVVVFNKLRARYLTSPKRKALSTWRREFLNWIAGERAIPGHQPPQPRQAPQHFDDSYYADSENADGTINWGPGFNQNRD